ncbi:ORF45L [Rana nigromaculata ranavirus]|uniref:ORF45L n=1 Tax=Rana nigromaculata ranavirus TaxID=2044919 RepID=A0A2P1GJN5_FRG3V|nr:ORF45L [Rana nigromaculata ranavirus]
MTFFVTVTLPGVVCRMHGELNLSFEQLCEVAFLIEDRRRPSNVTVKVVTVKGLSGSPDSVLVYSNGKYFCRDSDGSETLVVLCSVDNVDLPVVKFVVVPAVGATQHAKAAPAAPAVNAPAPAVNAPAPAFTGFTPFKPTSVFPFFGQAPATPAPAVTAKAPAVTAKAPAFTGFTPFKPTSVFPSFGQAPATPAAPAAPAPATATPATAAPAPATATPATPAPATATPATPAPATATATPATATPATATPAPAPATAAPAPAVNAPAVSAPASLFGPAQPSTSSMFAPPSSLFVPATAPAPSTSGFTIPANLRRDAYVCPFATAEKERKEREQQQPASKGLNHDLAAQEPLHPSLVSRFPSNYRGSFLR